MDSFDYHRVPRATLSLLASGLGPVIPKHIIETVHIDRISHLNLHANNFEYLGFHDDNLCLEEDSLVLEYLEHLDVSSNNLGRKSTPPANLKSVLLITSNLVYLNLATNQITSDSLAQIFHQGQVRLNGLKTLDLSHNWLVTLPTIPVQKCGKCVTNQDDNQTVIGATCPNIETLFLIDNRIHDLSLLLSALLPFKMVLKRLKLRINDQNVKECSNTVCTNGYYRDKLIHVLGSLLELDGQYISKEERNLIHMNNQNNQSNDAGKHQSLRVVMSTNVRNDDLRVSKCNRVSTKMCDYTERRVQTASECANHNQSIQKICHSPDKHLLDELRRQRCSITKLNDLATHIDSLTDLTQRHVEVSKIILNSSLQKMISQETPNEKLPVNHEEAQMQTSFILVEKECEKLDDNLGTPSVGQNIDFVGRLSLELLIIFTIQYYYMFMKDEQCRVVLKRLKLYQRKWSISMRTDNHDKQSISVTDINTSVLTERIKSMQNDIDNLTKKLFDSEDQIKSNTIQYQRDLKRLMLKMQDRQESKQKVWINYDQIARLERGELDWQNSLKDEKERCKSLGDELSQEKLMHMMDAQKHEIFMSRSEQEIRQLRSAFESLAKKLAEEKLKRSNLEHVVDDMNLMLRQKSLDLDNVTKNWLKEKNECDVIKNELTACRQRLSESKESTKMANKKQIECEEGAISLTLRLEQMDAALNEKSAELEFTRDKYKRKVEKLRDCERKNNMLAEELEKITKMGEEQKQHYSQLVEKLNNDFNTLQKNMLLSEQSLKTELDNLRNSIIDKDKNHLKEIDFLESHCRDATEKFRLLQTVEAEMDRLKRQNEKLTSKRDRAEHHVQILVQELEQERLCNHALNEQLREAHRAHESQYGKAKVFLENAYNEIMKPNNKS